jgi:TonB family protein
MAGMMAAVRGGDPETLGDKQTPPKLLHKVNPVYPPEAKEQKIQGTVILEALLDEKGDVAEVAVTTDKEKVKETPDPRLAKAAIDAVKQWKYEPYRDSSGKAQPVRFSVTINFKLK